MNARDQIQANIDGATAEQQRMFAVFCARKVEHLMKDDRSKQAVVMAEKFARSEVDGDDCSDARKAAQAAISNRYDFSAEAAKACLGWEADQSAQRAAWFAYQCGVEYETLLDFFAA